jgi:hypothetical protein
VEEFIKKAKQFGRRQAIVIIEVGHQRYNAVVGRGIVEKCIKILEEKINITSTEEKTARHKKTRTYEFAKNLAYIVIDAGELTQDASISRFVIAECVKILRERVDEIQPKKADPKYKKLRYGKNKKTRKAPKKNRKKKKTAFSPNTATLTMNSGQAACWPRVNVVGEGSRHRKPGSMLSK